MTRLSNRQYPMLQAFVQLGVANYMPVEDAQRYDQRPFRSMLIQRWVAFRPLHGFYITKEGVAAWREFQSTEIWRRDPTMPLTAYFDATAYGLRRRRPKKDKPHARRGAA